MLRCGIIRASLPLLNKWIRVVRGEANGNRNDAAVAKAKYLGETHGVRAVAYKVDGECAFIDMHVNMNGANEGSFELR